MGRELSGWVNVIGMRVERVGIGAQEGGWVGSKLNGWVGRIDAQVEQMGEWDWGAS